MDLPVLQLTSADDDMYADMFLVPTMKKTGGVCGARVYVDRETSSFSIDAVSVMGGNEEQLPYDTCAPLPCDTYLRKPETKFKVFCLVKETSKNATFYEPHKNYYSGGAVFEDDGGSGYDSDEDGMQLEGTYSVTELSQTGVEWVASRVSNTKLQYVRALDDGNCQYRALAIAFNNHRGGSIIVEYRIRFFLAY